MAEVHQPESLVSLGKGFTGEWAALSKLKKDYKLLEKIGTGTSGFVVKARRRSDGEYVAIKIIKRASLTSSMRSTIADESDLLQYISHGRVVGLVDTFEDDEFTCIVMEYVADMNLRTQLMERERGFKERDALCIIEGVLEALVHLHSIGIAHRDLKLENIMLVDRELSNAKLVDLGMAYWRKDPSMSDLCSKMCGTPQYLPPQIIDGAPYVPEEVDMWYIGVVLYTLIAKTVPFQAPCRKQLFESIISEDVCFEGSAWRKVSRRTKDLIVSLLSKDPIHRPCAMVALREVRSILLSKNSAPTDEFGRRSISSRSFGRLGSSRPTSGGSGKSKTPEQGGLFGMLMAKMMTASK